MAAGGQAPAAFEFEEHPQGSKLNVKQNQSGLHLLVGTGQDPGGKKGITGRRPGERGE